VYKTAGSHIGIKTWVNDNLHGSLEGVVIANYKTLYHCLHGQTNKNHILIRTSSSMADTKTRQSAKCESGP